MIIPNYEHDRFQFKQITNLDGLGSTTPCCEGVHFSSPCTWSGKVAGAGILTLLSTWDFLEALVECNGTIAGGCFATRESAERDATSGESNSGGEETVTPRLGDRGDRRRIGDVCSVSAE